MVSRVTGTQPMYHMSPFTLPNEPVYPSTSGMYRMEPYFPLQPPSIFSGDMSSESDEAVRQLESTHLEIQRELGTLKTRVDACSKKLFQTERDSEKKQERERGTHFAKLEQKQESINQMVNNLKQEMTLLKQQRRSGSARSTPEPPRHSAIQPPPVPIDAVVKCHPDRPPVATLLVFSHLQQFTAVSWRCMSHSSLPSPHPLCSSLLQHVLKSNRPKLVLTLIWRGDPGEPSLQVSNHQTPVYGDHNVARYLCRLHADTLYEGMGAERATEVDQWVNSFSTQLLAGSSKERQNVIKTLNAHFGKNRWLVGDQVSLADIVAFSLLTNQQVLSEVKLQKNVTEWIKRTSSEVPFSLPTLQPLFNIPQDQ